MHLNVSWPSFSLGTLVALSLSNLFPKRFSHFFSKNKKKRKSSWILVTREEMIHFLDLVDKEVREHLQERELGMSFQAPHAFLGQYGG